MWGVGGSVAKFLFNQAVSPFLLVKIRLTLSCLMLLVGIGLFKRQLLYIKRQDILYFALLGVVGMSLVQFTYFYTISLTNVATAVFLEYLSPVFMATYAVLWEKARMSWRRGGAVALASCGGLFIMLGAAGVSGINPLGLVSGLASAVVMAFNTIYGRRAAREYHPVTAITYSFGFGALFWWILMPYGWEAGSITTQHWLMFLYIAVFSTVVPFFLYFTGIRYLPPTNVGVTACLEPVIAAGVAFLVLDEMLNWLQIAGGLLVVVAVIILQTSSIDEEQGAQEVPGAKLSAHVEKNID